MAHTPQLRRLIRILQLSRRTNLQQAGLPPPLQHSKCNRSRRYFLQSVGAAGVMAAMSDLVHATGPMRDSRDVKIAIIGGGLAGLNATYQLKKMGIKADLYEAGTRTGGRVLSRRGLISPYQVTELGAEFINTDHDDMLQLAQEFELPLFNRRDDAQSVAVPPSGYFLEGTSWPEIDIAESMRALAAQITSDADLLDQNWERYAPRFDRHSVSEYLDMHAGLIPAPFVRTLIENTIRTEYGAEPEESTALQLLFLLPTVDGQHIELLGYSDETYVVEGGNQRIADALTNELGEQVHTGWQLTQLDADARGEYELGFANGQTVEATHVILAIPFTVLREVRLNIAMPAKFRRFIDEAGLGRNEKVAAGYNTRPWHNDYGFSLEAWTDLGFSEVWESKHDAGRVDDAALMFYLGGKEVDAINLSGGSAERIGREFTRALDNFAPGLNAATTGQFVQTHWTRHPQFRGSYSNFAPGQLTRFGSYFWIESDDPAERQEVHFGNLVIAGEQVSDAYYGFMNGAAQTGRLAAQWVYQQITACRTDTRGKNTQVCEV